MDAPLLLAVDDDADVRAVAVDVLSAAGYRLLEAESGEAALEFLRAGEPIDLVLSDMIMPGLNGLDLMRQVIAMRPQTRFVFTSGYWPHIVAALDSAAILQKPYGSAELVRIVRKALDGDAGPTKVDGAVS